MTAKGEQSEGRGRLFFLNVGVPLLLADYWPDVVMCSFTGLIITWELASPRVIQERGRREQDYAQDRSYHF